MAKTFNQFTKKIDELYWPKAGDEAKFMAMHGPYTAADVGGKETHDDAVFKGTIVGKDESHAHTDAEFRPDAQSELNDLIKNIHSKDTDELLKTVSHLNLSTDPKHREARDVINKELMYRYKNHAVNEELIGGQKKLDADGDKHLTAKDFAILRARKNKKKMNEELGFKPTKITIEPHPEGHHAVAHGPGGQKKNITQFPVGRDSAARAAADTAKEHGLTADKNKPYGSHFSEASDSPMPTHDSNRIFTYYGKGGYYGGSHTHVYANPKGDKHERFQVIHQKPDRGGPHGMPRMKVSYHPDALSAQAHAEKLAGKGAERVREEIDLNEAFDVYVHDEKGGKEGRRVNHSKFFQTREVIDHLKNGHKVTVTHTRNDHVNKVVLHPGDHVKEKTKGIDIHPGVTYQGPDGPFSGIEEEYELDEGKFGNAMAKFTGPSKVPVLSKFIHGLQTRSAAAAAKKSKANPDNFNKLMNYANARNKVREESEVEEGYVSVNGQRVGGYRNRSPLTRIQKTPAEIARHKAGFDAVTKIIDKMNAPGGINSPERHAEIDADLKKKRNAELTAAGRKPLPETNHKSHKIARAIMMNEKVNLNTEEIELEDGNVIEIDIELAEAIADLFDSLDEDDQDALAEMLHSDIESFMEVVDLLENDGE